MISEVIGYIANGKAFKKSQQEFLSTTLQLIGKAHEVGIHLVFQQQSLKINTITKKIVENCSSRIAFYMNETKPALMFAGTKDPISLNIFSGKMLYYHDGTAIKGVSPRIERSELNEIFKHIKFQC